MPTDTCPTCGRPLDEHDRHVRFVVPDPVLELPERERAPGTWMTDDTANESVMMQVPAVGAFVRVLLPVKLTDGHRVTFGVWIAVDPDDLRHAWEVWWDPAYKELRLEGLLANGLPHWGLLGRPVVATVLQEDETPYCTSSTDPELSRVLTQEWDHATVLSQLPSR